MSSDEAPPPPPPPPPIPDPDFEPLLKEDLSGLPRIFESGITLTTESLS